LKKRVTLVTGGAKSGKSSHALELSEGYSKRVFIATAEAFDDEMRERIRRHQAERGSTFETVEESLDPAGALRSLPEDTDLALIDCLTVWQGNLMHRHGIADERYPEAGALLEVLKNPPCELILVSNEVGLGIVPDNPMARRFRDLAGEFNQRAAEAADRVVLVVSGIPLVLKERSE
jgi:adenosylcobinamide kinase/adenosylcobinamide-phosphate guanylyltransferase